jgi:type IV pilus assembly protein PilC
MPSVPLEQIAFFYRKLASMISAGVQLERALEAQMGSGHEYLDSVVDGLHKKICSGWSLSKSMAQYPDIFTPVSIGLMGAGEQTGGMARVLEKMAELKEQAVRLKKMVISALTYPGILMLTVLAVGVLFVTVVCPEDGGLFGAMGAELPWPSRLLVEISRLFRSPLFFLGLPAFLVACGLFARSRLQKSPELRLKLDEVLLNLPVVGPLVQKAAAARVVFILGSSLQMGLTLGTALNLACRVAGNRAVAERLKRARQGVMDGEGLGEALANQRVLPPMVTSVIESGEASGRLDELLNRAALQLEEDVQMTVMAAARLLEPLLMIGAGLAAGLVALASLLPLIDLVNHL